MDWCEIWVLEQRFPVVRDRCLPTHRDKSLTYVRVEVNKITLVDYETLLSAGILVTW